MAVSSVGCQRQAVQGSALWGAAAESGAQWSRLSFLGGAGDLEQAQEAPTGLPSLGRVTSAPGCVVNWKPDSQAAAFKTCKWIVFRERAGIGDSSGTGSEPFQSRGSGRHKPCWPDELGVWVPIPRVSLGSWGTRHGLQTLRSLGRTLEVGGVSLHGGVPGVEWTVRACLGLPSCCDAFSCSPPV